ncbi:MAG: hypothetical protein L3J35_04315 [Bacteroidales bacterium]|nr:hypothetical protein [Bacteroidales bacterium]
MRKIIFTLLAVLFSTIMFSQEDGTTEVVNKHGVSVLPKAGDFALGIDASPFFNLVGNMLRINDFTGPFADPMAFNFVDGGSIYGKYFLSDDAAVRVRFDINMMSQTLNNLVVDDANTNARVTDTWKHSASGVNLGVGYEMRRGKGRLQAFYGGELNLMFGGGSKDVYTYGNELNNSDSIPTTTVNWLGMTSMGVDNRLTEVTNAGGFGFGLRAFVGAEYFLFPNISFGGEFGWGFGINSVGEGTMSTESWDYTNHERTTNDTKIAGSSGFNLGNDNLGGNVYMMFHF